MTQPPVDSASLPQHPQSEPGGPAPYGQPTIAPSTTRATWGLVLCIIPTTLTNIVGAVLCIVVLANRRDPRNGGTGRAIAGLVVFGVYALALVLLLAIGAAATLGTSTSDPGDGTSDTERSGSVFIVDLRTSDCLRDALDEGEVTTVDIVPCRRPHEGQVVGVFTLARGDWPGEKQVDRLAAGGCRDRADRNAPGRAAKRLDLSYFTPVKETWDQDRSVQCILEGRRRTGSVLASATPRPEKSA